MARVRKDPHVRRNEILDTAQTLFIENGFMNVTVNDIAKKVGIARTTFYEYYTDKTQILVDMVDRAITTFKISLPQGDTIYQKLLHLAVDMLNKFDANRELYTLVFREAPILSDNISENLAKWRYDNASITRAMITEAHHNQLLHNEVSIEDAVFIFTALLGQRAGDILIADEEIDAETEAQHIVKLVWRNIKAPTINLPTEDTS
ncbi:MAG: TetR/AcrR family transcriptional regulator [Anaerolineales bacterium]|nr:TetR/AcrR family transcriptional regulator [Anaerolineales bacterium]